MTSEQIWPASTFQIASRFGLQNKRGYTYRGLGLFMVMDGSPKGKRKPKWSLTHLGTGHCVAEILGSVVEVMPPATDLACAGDWTFDGLNGYENQFPDIAERMREWLVKYPNTSKGGGGGAGKSEEQAREIAMVRS